MDKILVIHRPTRLDSLVARFNTRQQAKFYVEHLNADFGDYEREHETYRRALDSLVKTAASNRNVQLVDWKYLPNFLFGKNDLVVTVGQDGLVANTLKYLSEQKVIGINPDPERWDGVLSQFSVGESDLLIKKALNGDVAVRSVTKAKVTLTDNQVLYAVNDFFIGVKNHSSARYSLTLDDRTENHSSSGIIVSTPLGRSGWMKSIITGANGISNKLAATSTVIREKKANDWGRDQLTFAVREPFPSVSTSAQLVFGTVKKDTVFSVESKMGENGFIFSDGIQEDFLDFNYSIVANITIAETKGNIVVRK